MILKISGPFRKIKVIYKWELENINSNISNE